MFFKILGLFLGVFYTLKATPYLYLGEEPKYKDKFTHFEYVNPNAPKGGVLRNDAIGTFDSLNPFIIKGTKVEGLDLIYDTLMAQSLDEPYAEYPLIAKDAEVAKDNSYVIFTLDKRARFSNNAPILAVDVKFSFDTIMKLGSPIYKQYYQDVEKCVILDKHRVKFIFKTTENKELPLILGQLQIFFKKAFQKDYFDKNPLLIPVSSGPYVISSFNIGKRVVYRRNFNYWAKNLPSRKGQFNFNQVRFEYYKDETIALQAFLSGAYDWRIESVAKIWARGYTGKAIENKEIIKHLIHHKMPSGMQGFFFNTRREVFKDKRVREALFYAFDFEWANKNLFFSQYERTTSFFNNSVYASSLLPSPEEKALLTPYQKILDERVFNEPFVVPRTDGADVLNYNLRENLKYAQQLLKNAGYTFKNMRLIDPKTHKPFSFTLLLNSPAFERLALAYAKNLKILGIEMKIKRMDLSQYMNRLKSFDFDMIVGVIGQSPFPGNEQRFYFSSYSAKEKGSRNYAGISNKAVDNLIEKVIMAKTHDERVNATRALDRVLLWGFYVVPHFYLPNYRLAVWKKIGMPTYTPSYGFSPYLWWDNTIKSSK
ncbi:extracellular solute-binding protein [Helicobacter cetorum]|uniref:extracellular solute-binding protein n=1 Tax=Helicobacter cetorum TaxID=138563 RepID=UPI000CF1165B|nr:extracellular solute-binding protein [Helicobacter cetorum]